MNFIGDYWGKARPDGEGLAAHPLACHCLDVAAVIDRLLDVWPWALHAIADLAGLDQVTARRWLRMVAALHDLGKFADSFQAKIPELWRGKSTWTRAGTQPHFDHGAFGLNLWNELGGAQRLGLSEDNKDRFERWLKACASHHGRPVTCAEVSIKVHIQNSALADAGTFIDALAKLFQFCTEDATVVPIATARDHRCIESWLIAGLCVIADWVGSNQIWFRYPAEEQPIFDYWAFACQRAVRAVDQAGLHNAPARASFNLADIFQTESMTPSPLQQAAAACALGNGPTLAFIEDLTGAGKTEAALLLAHRMMRAGKAQGLYWALPTQATSNKMYERLAKAYRAMFAADARPSLVLAHGSVDMFQDFWSSVVVDGNQIESDAIQETASAQCAAWLADDRRKVFLGQVGVGTLDQALLAAMPAKFNTLRLVGLAGRVLIIDEVHSYDAYMTTLLCALLRFQSCLGGSAILLSATLTTATKNRLLQAYCGDRHVSSNIHAFPLVSALSGGQLLETPVALQRGTRRDLPVVLVHDHEEVVAHLGRVASQGGCAVWIRNTVQDALDAFDLLCSAHLNAQTHLFHARFTLQDRIAREVDILQMFDKASMPPQRSGQILIATQVVEQSLDIDFDAMVTDLAPMDLIIQRAGRLQRHERSHTRPAPLLMVLCPAEHGEIRANWFRAMFPRGAFVYDNHARLWCTQRSLARGLNMASTNPREVLEEIEMWLESGDYPACLQKSADTAYGKASGDKSSAEGVMLQCERGFGEDGRGGVDEGMILTRRGEPTKILRLARWDGETLRPMAGDTQSHRNWRLSEVQVAIRKFEELSQPDPQLIRAMSVARDRWSRNLQVRESLQILPLVADDQTGGWHAHVKADNGDLLVASYSQLRGLVFART